MKGWHGLVAVVVVLGVSSFGCTASDGVASGSSWDNAAVGGTWRYVAGSFQGRQIPPLSEYPVTLKIEADGFSGVATCNHYAGQLRNSASSEWRVGQMSATEINCAQPAETSAIGYFKALRAAHSIAVTEAGALRLFGAGADLRFIPVRVTRKDGGHPACPPEHHDLRSNFTKAMGLAEFDAVRICRYRSADDGSGGRPGDPVVSGDYELVGHRGLDRDSVELLLRLLTAAEPSPPRCAMIDSLPPVSDVVTLLGRGGRRMTVTVGHPQCLGLAFGGRHWKTPTALIRQLDAWLDESQ